MAIEKKAENTSYIIIINCYCSAAGIIVNILFVARL